MSIELEDLIYQSHSNYKNLMAVASEGTYLYGAGFIGRWAVSYLESIGIPVLGFIDSDPNKWGKIIKGKKVFCLSDECVIQSKSIIITSRHAVKQVERLLIDLSAIIMSVDALVVHRYNELGIIPNIKKLFSHDIDSQNTFTAVLSAMLSGSAQYLMHVADNRPFFDKFGFFNCDQEIFVDAGAYVGDSLERFIWSVNGVFHQIHAFEPGTLQFRALEKRVARLTDEWALKLDNLFLINKGLSSSSKKALINTADNLIQMSISEEKPLLQTSNTDVENIDLISLDSYFNGKRYTFLKVDVEGSELALLQGAKQSIAMHKPKVALSVYHYPIDIFELPLQLKAIHENYTFFLGHHSSQLMDTVLYARDQND